MTEPAPLVGGMYLVRDTDDFKLIHVYPGPETRETLQAVNGYKLYLTRNYPSYTADVHWNEAPSQETRDQVNARWKERFDCGHTE